MDVNAKRQKIGVAYNAIETVLRDTDEDSYAAEHLEDALSALKDYFEEYDL